MIWQLRGKMCELCNTSSGPNEKWRGSCGLTETPRKWTGECMPILTHNQPNSHLHCTPYARNEVKKANKLYIENQRKALAEQSSM